MKRISLILSVLVLALGCSDKGPRIESVAPTEITAAAPALIEISGKGFKKGAGVKVGEDACPQVVVVSSKKIVALLPELYTAGLRDVVVENPDGKTGLAAGALNIKSALALEAVTPSFLPENASIKEVRMRGKNFLPGARVFFDGQESASVKVLSKETIVAEPPPMQPGIKDVKVINPDGSEALLASAFQVLAAGEELPVQTFKESAREFGIEGPGRDGHQDTGVAVADVDRDGLMDVLVVGAKQVRLYLGGKDGFKLAQETVLDLPRFSYGGYFGDFDNDGLPDLLLSGQPPRLFHNLGGARFEDVTKRVGLPQIKAWCAVWMDYDLDGLLDLFIGTLKGDDHLFRNAGGRLVEVYPDMFEKAALAKELGNDQPSSFSAAAADYDQDGYPDLYVGVRAMPSYLLKNLQGKGFENVIEKLGLPVSISSRIYGKVYPLDWGVTWADVDNDGFFDLFLASGALGDKLFINREGKEFMDRTRQTRTRFPGNALCPLWGDMNNDGFLDLAIADNMRGVQMFKNNGDGSFREITGELGLSLGQSTPQCLAWLDVNNDGALDLFVPELLIEDSLYLNKPYPGRHYLMVDLEGTTDNAMGIGAVVSVKLGSTVLTRRVSGGESYLVSPSPRLHFGLGSAQRADSVTVRWPAGQIQKLEQVPANQLIKITQPGKKKTIEIPEVEDNDREEDKKTSGEKNGEGE